MEQFLPTVQHFVDKARVYLNYINQLCEAFKDIMSSNADAMEPFMTSARDIVTTILTTFTDCVSIVQRITYLTNDLRRRGFQSLD